MNRNKNQRSAGQFDSEFDKDPGLMEDIMNSPIGRLAILGRRNMILNLGMRFGIIFPSMINYRELRIMGEGINMISLKGPGLKFFAVIIAVIALAFGVY